MVHTHMIFFVMCNAYTPPPPFVTIFTFRCLFPRQMVHLLPIPNVECAMYELCVVPTLGTPKTARGR